VLTSNRGFSDWGAVFADQVVAAAILDRLLHHATVITIKGKATACAATPTPWTQARSGLCSERGCALFTISHLHPSRSLTGFTQMQERLTKQIAEWLNQSLKPRGVGVVLQAEHTCMTLRGVQAYGTRMVTSELLGVLRDDPAARAEFFDLTGVART
jgi:hypothetical protein